MERSAIDLKKQQQATLARPRFPYSKVARLFFTSMDMATGRKNTLSKALLIEMLAGIPYHAWERRQYVVMTRDYRNQGRVDEARAVLSWARAARANERWHQTLVEAKLREEGATGSWYLTQPIPRLMQAGYAVLSWALARADIRRAYLFNAEFEDHAEHTYAEMVREHAEWEAQPVGDEALRTECGCDTWADVFRRVGLDERDHMNNSFRFAGRDKWVVRYEGMPDDVVPRTPGGGAA